MPDVRSSRFARPFARTGSLFSRLRDQPRNTPQHRHGPAEPNAPVLPSSGMDGQTQLIREPQWAFTDGHRCYPAVPAAPGLELLPRALWSATNTQTSICPDPVEAGPEDEPGDEDEDDGESTGNDLFLLFNDQGERELFDQLLADELDDELPDDEFGAEFGDDFVAGGWWADDSKPEFLAKGPLSPPDDLTPWPIETPDDAIDTFELLRSSTFQSGLVVLVLDHDRVPFLHVALRGNSVDDMDRAIGLFCPSLPNGRIPCGLILGVVRPQHREPPQSVLDSGETFGEPSIWVEPAESSAWRIAAWRLHDERIKLHDVLVIEPDRWISLAHSAGVIAYNTVQYA